MKIDNFNLISKYFDAKNPSDFYTIIIVRRQKDFTSIKVKERPIHSYFVFNLKEFEELKEEIALLCTLYGARAYMNLNSKNPDKLQKRLMTELARYNEDGTKVYIDRVVLGIAGKLEGETRKYMIDIDDMNYLDPILKYFNGEFEYDIIPTIHGCHMIMPKFNTKAFNDKFPNIDIHKNSMGTLLYYNSRKFEINYGLRTI